MTVLSTGVEFMRPAAAGRVHVHDRIEPAPGLPGLFQRQVALCGRRGRPGVYETVIEFDDRDLCARCWQATPADDRSSLFDHPQTSQ